MSERPSRTLHRSRAPSPTAELVPWIRKPPRDGETVRWEHFDGRWVALTLGFAASAGKVLVTDSSGRCEAVDGHDAALALARSWRT